MSSLGGYPAGAQYDPNAPWNEPIARNEKVRVKVSLVLEKEFNVFVPSYPEGDPKDPDYTFSQEDLEAAVHDQTILPHEAWKKIDVNAIPYATIQRLVHDLKGWEVMDEEIDTV